MPLALLLAQLAAPDLVAAARARTAAETRCPETNTTDVTVCGLRRADRFRVPYVVVDLGDPAHEGVPAERERLLRRTTPVQDMGPFLVGGGMVGVSMAVGDGKSGARIAGLRPPAP